MKTPTPAEAPAVPSATDRALTQAHHLRTALSLIADPETRDDGVKVINGVVDELSAGVVAGVASPSEDFAGLVQAYGSALEDTAEWRTESYRSHDHLFSNSGKAKAALLAHGARLEAEAKDWRNLWRTQHERADKAEAEIDRLRTELAERDAALARAAKPIAHVVPEEVSAVLRKAQNGLAAFMSWADCLDDMPLCLSERDEAWKEVALGREALAAVEDALLPQQTPGDAP